MTNLFPDILGHENVKRGLIHATQTGHMHHAFLFVGSEGIGKGLLGKAFIQAWLCEHTTSEKLARCKICHNCKRIANTSHPDFIEIIEESATIKIDTIRELQKRLAFPPFESARRFVMIHDIHKMQDAAANCLLKTLEEPEEHTTFILITSQIQRLLPTIISRCQVVRFAPFSVDEISHYLIEHGVSPEISGQLATLSDGSLSMAQELNQGDYKTELISTFEDILKISSTLDAFSTAAALKGKKSMSAHLLSLLLAYTRDMLILKSSPETPILLENYRSQMLTRLSKTSIQDLIRCIQLIQEVNESFLGNLNEQVVWERLLVGMHGVLF